MLWFVAGMFTEWFITCLVLSISGWGFINGLYTKCK